MPWQADIQSHDANVIAEWFINHHKEKTGGKLTIMKLLKLVYIAHGWHLESFGLPLIRNRIEAWKYGPGIPDIYDTYRSNDVDVIDVEPAGVSLQGIGKEQHDFLEDVYDAYGDIRGPVLSVLTHVDNGPWDITRKSKGHREAIDDDVIKRHYQSLRKELSEE